MMDSGLVRNMQSTLSNKSEKQCISLAFSIRTTYLYIATARNCAIMSGKFKSDILYLRSCSPKDNKDNNKQHNYKRRQYICYSNVQCLNKEIHFGPQLINRKAGFFKVLPETSFPSVFLISNFRLFCMLYVFFWVIPRRLDFICRRFGTLPVPSSQAGRCRMTKVENVGVSMREKVGSKIA